MSYTTLLIALIPKCLTDAMEHKKVIPLTHQGGENGRRPDAVGETIMVGMPNGSAAMAYAPITAPSEPPRQRRPGAAPPRTAPAQSGARPRAFFRIAAPRLDDFCSAAIVVPAAAATNSRVISAHATAGAPKIPGIHNQRERAERAQPVADVGDLRPLGVERADQRDRGLHIAASEQWSNVFGGCGDS